MYEVHLANVGNPDRGQDPTQPVYGTESGIWKPVGSLREASQACRNYIEDNELGGGNWSGGKVRRVSDGEVVAEISYNGRAWTPKPEGGNWQDQQPIDLDTTFESSAPKP